MIKYAVEQTNERRQSLCHSICSALRSEANAAPILSLRYRNESACYSDVIFNKKRQNRDNGMIVNIGSKNTVLDNMK